MKKILLLGLSLVLFNSCFYEQHFEDTKAGNFEALWTIMDEHYCFFEYKNVDWDSIYYVYKPRVFENMPNESFFDLMGDMLAEVKDGHVNLYASHDIARYWDWFENYPQNFDENIQRNYLKTDYQIASGLKYKVLPDNVGYIYYESFMSAIGEGNLDQVISKLSVCHGIIIDVRNNGGGSLSNVEVLASRFFNDKTLVSYIMHKTGKKHNDFSTPYARYIEPSKRLRYQKDVVVLTNRSSYSATNDFVNTMRYAPNVTIIGDKTGGGSGLPFSSELPNGWSVRFSASPMLNAEKEHTEFGIDPDVSVDMDISDMQYGIDTMIEKAREYLLRNR